MALRSAYIRRNRYISHVTICFFALSFFSSWNLRFLSRWMHPFQYFPERSSRQTEFLKCAWCRTKWAGDQNKQTPHMMCGGDSGQKAHWPAPFTGGREVAGCETPGGVFFVVVGFRLRNYQAHQPTPFFVVVKGGGRLRKPHRYLIFQGRFSSVGSAGGIEQATSRKVALPIGTWDFLAPFAPFHWAIGPLGGRLKFNVLDLIHIPRAGRWSQEGGGRKVVSQGALARPAAGRKDWIFDCEFLLR